MIQIKHGFKLPFIKRLKWNWAYLIWFKNVAIPILRDGEYHKFTFSYGGMKVDLETMATRDMEFYIDLDAIISFFTMTWAFPRVSGKKGSVKLWKL